MRNFSLREKQSVITVLREPPKKTKKFPWQKWTFIAVMIAVLGLIAYKAISNLWIINANGQIEVKKQTVHFADDVSITKFFVSEGQTIEKGDTLFTYKPLVEDVVSTSITDFDKSNDWIEREKLELQAKIAQLTFEIEILVGRINNSNVLAKQKRDMILLGSVNDKNEFEYLTLDIKKMQLELSSMEKEKKYLQSMLYGLGKRGAVPQQKVTTSTKKTGEEKTAFVAPMDGVIGQINFDQNEICFRREEILTIHKLEDMKIKVYFDPYEMKYLNTGDDVIVTFPDGSDSKGVITNFHVATYALPDEFQKKYEPTERNIVANVELSDNLDEYKLMNFYKMNVRITKSRFNLPI